MQQSEFQVKTLRGDNNQVGRMYNHSVNIYNKSENVLVVKGCFAYMFTNIGDVIARVNGMVIFPSSTPATSLGDSRSVSGHLLDIYKGNMTLAFDANTLGVNPQVEIVQLFYLGDF